MGMIKKVINRNHFMLVYLKSEELKFPIIIPIPLWALEDILTSLSQFSKVMVRVFPQLQRKLVKHIEYIDLHIEDLLKISEEVFQELRKIGRFTLVEVKESDCHVLIKLY